jgi:TPR repeat protein
MFNKNNNEEAEVYLKMAADQGDSDAMFKNGRLISISQPETAKGLFVAAAQKGSAQALCELGMMDKSSQSSDFLEQSSELGI